MITEYMYKGPKFKSSSVVSLVYCRDFKKDYFLVNYSARACSGENNEDYKNISHLTLLGWILECIIYTITTLMKKEEVCF